jgi:lipoprotein-anchoring transpeptidase ErfK/SrfK
VSLRGVAVAGKLSFPNRSHRRIALVAAGGTAALLALGACTSGTVNNDNAAAPAATGTTGASSSAPAPSTSSSSTPPALATIDLTPGTHTDVDPTTPVSLTVANGTLTKVTMTNPAGKRVTGALASNGASWHTTEVLGYAKTYRISARAVNSAGKPTATKQRLTTVSPSATTTVTMDRMGGYALDSGETYGVAIVPVVHFDTAISNEKAAQKTLSVTTSQKVGGVWSWIDNQDVAYRPKNYWPSGTKVTVAAHVYGKQLGKGLYGESDESAHFTVGRKQLTVADDNSPNIDKVRVYNAAGKVLRTMDTSMGKHGGETLSNGQYINFYTLDGTYTVLDHENPAIMSSQSYGLPADAPSGYAPLSVPYSTKISTDGIYLHEFNSTIYEQEHGEDVSEGCLNLQTSDAVWFFDHSMVGDPVVVHGAKGAPEIQPWEGGYWSIPWSKWKAASAA